MTTTNKILTFLALAVAGVFIYKSATKKSDATTSTGDDGNKSDFLGFSSKKKSVTLAKRWCQLNIKRINILKSIETAHGMAQVGELYKQLAQTIEIMNGILTLLHSQGYTIGDDCRLIPLDLHGKSSKTGPDWQGQCKCGNQNVWAAECCNK